MNHAHTTIYAAHSAGSCVLTSVRSLALACTVGCAMAANALALPNDNVNGNSPPQHKEERAQAARAERPAPQRQEARAEAARVQEVRAEQRADSRADEARRGQQEQGARNQDAFKRNGHLTADERRDLRRQINEAGQDIYRDTPRR